MRRLLVNDALNQLGEHTFWNDLQEWFGMDFIGGDYSTLADKASIAISCGKLEGKPTSLIVRNSSWFPPIKTDVPTISLLQDIFAEGPLRKMQEAVLASSRAAVFNSEFTRSKYGVVNKAYGAPEAPIIPLPVDFDMFAPQNAMGCQQMLSLPDGCVCWIGASQGAAGHIKGFDIFLSVVRANPDLPFVAVFKDAAPEYVPPNLRTFVRLSHHDLVKVIGACRVGLCTSRTESQHLAGIEMGACGLPMVAPPVGVYWNRAFPGCLSEPNIQAYTNGIRSVLRDSKLDTRSSRNYWRKEFDKPVIKAAWMKLIDGVENAS